MSPCKKSVSDTRQGLLMEPATPSFPPPWKNIFSLLDRTNFERRICSNISKWFAFCFSFYRPSYHSYLSRSIQPIQLGCEIPEERILKGLRAVYGKSSSGIKAGAQQRWYILNTLCNCMWKYSSEQKTKKSTEATFQTTFYIFLRPS